MGWPYHFVTLNPAQIAERRQLLDQAGYYAYLTPIVILAAVYLYRQATATAKESALSSEKAKVVVPSILEVQRRRIAWWLNEPLTPEFGARKVHLLGLAYAGWLLFLIFRKTGHDYLHLTKCFGHVAASQLPIQYMMAIKSPLSPVQAATGLSWENLNDYHRLFGRIVHALVITHAVMYMNFFVQAGVLYKRLGDTDVRVGLVAFAMFNIIGLFSIPPIRKSAYHQKFFRSHAIQTGLVLIALFFHVSYLRKYIVQAVILYLFNGISRTKSTSSEILSTISALDGTAVSTGLLKLRIPTPLIANTPLTWIPGQHIYLKTGLTPFHTRNPFTIISLPPDEHSSDGAPHVDLVVRNRGGPGTAWLAPKHHQTKTDDRMEHVMIEGPYGEAKSYMPALLASDERAGKILVVAGGIGATFTTPIYLSLLRARQSTTNVHFVWFVKSLDDATWGIQLLQAAATDVDVRIYLTRSTDKSLMDTAKAALGELQTGFKILNYGKRPAMKDIVDRYFAPPVTVAGTMLTTGTRGKDFTPVTVLSCGPPSMAASLREAVGQHVMEYGRGVTYHEETFGHGASLEKVKVEQTFREKGLKNVLTAQSL